MGGGPSKMKFKRGPSKRHKEAVKYMEQQEKRLCPNAKAPDIDVESLTPRSHSSSSQHLRLPDLASGAGAGIYAGSSPRQPSASPRCHSLNVGLQQPGAGPRCRSGPAGLQRGPAGLQQPSASPRCHSGPAGLRAAATGDDYHRAMLKACSGCLQPDLPHAIGENNLPTPLADPRLGARSPGPNAREQPSIIYNGDISPRPDHPRSPSPRPPPRGRNSEPPMPAGPEDEPKAPPSGTWHGTLKEYGAERRVSRELIFQEDGRITGRGGSTDPGAKVSGPCHVRTLSWMEIHPWGKLNLKGSVMLQDGTYVIKGSFSTTDQSRGPVELRFTAGSSRRRSA